MGLAAQRTGRDIEQVVSPRRKTLQTAATGEVAGPSWRERWESIRPWIGRSLWALGALALVWGTYRVIHSPAFTLAQITIQGQNRQSQRDIERLVRQTVPGSLLTASLTEVEQNIESLPWVHHAQITRILPNRLHIQVEERKPLLLVQGDQGNLVWIDEEGIPLETYAPDKDQNPPPIVIGLVAGNTEQSLRENLDRIAVYKKLIWSLDSGTPQFSSKLESINLSRLEDVVVQLSDNPIVIHLGQEEFRDRLVRAMEVLDMVQRRDAQALEKYQIRDTGFLKYADQINSITAVNSAQISLGFRTDAGEPAEKSVKSDETRPKPTVEAADKPAASRPAARETVKPAKKESVKPASKDTKKDTKKVSSPSSVAAARSARKPASSTAATNSKKGN
ncbi:MAG: FtsQ-type POTRA domain-containing protein [Acidobacteria bacterium]|nr:FtsQ-type POTRA domain-containing protein [Acidobacteriota bacterium]